VQPTYSAFVERSGCWVNVGESLWSLNLRAPDPEGSQNRSLNEKTRSKAQIGMKAVIKKSVLVQRGAIFETNGQTSVRARTSLPKNEEATLLKTRPAGQWWIFIESKDADEGHFAMPAAGTAVDLTIKKALLSDGFALSFGKELPSRASSKTVTPVGRQVAFF
jgi:hypothetical protein